MKLPKMFATAGLAALVAGTPALAAPPVAAVRDQADTLHGVTVPDPFGSAVAT